MKIATTVALVDKEKCIGCKICEKICPTLAVHVIDKKAVVDLEKCLGCGNCNQRCPENIVTMVKREEPKKVFVDPQIVSKDEIEQICTNARLNPEQIICYCTTTRAEEVAAAIVQGADTPEKISLLTGIRTGCKVECIQPILRLLKAAGVTPEKPDGYQWYGITTTLWEIPEEVKQKYSKRGFYFEEDIKVLDDVAKIRKEDKS